MVGVQNEKCQALSLNLNSVDATSILAAEFLALAVSTCTIVHLAESPGHPFSRLYATRTPQRSQNSQLRSSSGTKFPWA